MLFTLAFNRDRLGHICSNTNVDIYDTTGQRVGYIQPDAALELLQASPELFVRDDNEAMFP